LNILVVDDDIVDRETVKRSIGRSEMDYSITEASCVDDALALCNKRHFDVVLLDYRMPQRDGVELVIELGKLSLERSNVIVMMSNSENEQLAIDCIQAGAQDFMLKKDITPIRLRRTILQAQKRFELEQELRRSFHRVKMLAERDQLTSLANRYLFEESFKVSIANMKRSHGMLALVLFDVDNFKLINDSFGHNVGDSLLVQLCDRVKSCLRGNELFARLGGDEFVLALTELDNEQKAARVVARLHDSLKAPFNIEGHEIRASISAGISVYDREHAATADELLKHADIAMYRSKQQGKGRTTFFARKLQEQVENRVKIESRLAKALGNNEFFLLYQPLFNAKDARLCGCEALLRWRSGDITYSPDEFIPIAEESKKILEIGKWVVSEGISQLAKWRSYSKSKLLANMSINFSAVQLTDPQLIEHIRQECRVHQIMPGNLGFELTETALIGDEAARAPFLEQLRQLGCSIALDDFGTGYSSISHLLNFPISTVKIDKSVIPSFEDKDHDAALLSGLVKMIQTMELKSVAEGIENEKMADFCRNIGVDLLQGYYLSKPLTAKEFEQRFL